MQCYIFLHLYIFYISHLSENFVFHQDGCSLKEAYGEPTIILIKKFHFWKENIHWEKRAQTPQIRPLSGHIPLSTCFSPTVVFIRVFPGSLKVIPNLLLDYWPITCITVALQILAAQGIIHSHVKNPDSKSLTIK